MTLTNPSLTLTFGNDLEAGHQTIQTITGAYIVNHSIQQRWQLLNGLKSSSNQISLQLLKNCTATEDIIRTDLDVLAMLKDGDSVLFTGYVSTNFNWVLTDHGEEALSITIEDVGTRLFSKAFIESGYRRFDCTLSVAVAAICESAGVTVSSECMEINSRVGKTVEPDKTCRDILDQMLYENNCVYFFDVYGELRLFRIGCHTTEGIPELDKDTLMAVNGTAISLSRKIRTYRSVRVSYQELGTATNYLVYRNTTGASGDNTCIISLQPGEHFDGAAIYSRSDWAAETADQFREPTLVAACNAGSESAIVGNNEILAVRNIRTDAQKGPGIDISIVAVGGKHMQIDCHNNGSYAQLITKLDAYADITYQKNTSVIRTGTVSGSASLFSEELEYVHDRDLATSHANLVCQYNANGNSQYTFYTKEQIGLGSIIKLNDNAFSGLSVNVMVVAKSGNSMNSVYQYTAIGIGAFDLNRSAYHGIANKGNADVKGRKGSDGKDAVSYWIDKSASIISKNVNASNALTPSTITLTAKRNVGGVIGRFTDGIIKVWSGTDTVGDPLLSSFDGVLTFNASASVSTYTAVLFDGASEIDRETIPIIEAGKNGKQYYSFVRYASDSNGTDMLPEPTPQTKYIGTYAGTSSNPSASAYKWSRYVGNDGQDAVQYYTHVRYSANADGSGYVTTPTSDTEYVGIYVGTSVSAPAYNVEGWTWSKYVGNDGADAVIAVLTNDSAQVPADSSGNVSSYVSAQTSISLYKGGVKLTSGVSYGPHSTAGCAISNSTDSTVSVSAMSSDSAAVILKASYGGNFFTKTFTITKQKQGVQGIQGVSFSGIVEHYLASASPSGVTTSTSGWDVQITLSPTLKYLWNYETISRSDGTSSNTAPRIVAYHKDKGISQIEDYYALSANATRPAAGEFTTTVKTVDQTNRYLWNYSKITYTDGSSDGDSSKSRVIGVYGEKGNPGDAGAPARGILMSASSILVDADRRASGNVSPIVKLTITRQNIPGTDGTLKINNVNTSVTWIGSKGTADVQMAKASLDDCVCEYTCTYEGQTYGAVVTIKRKDDTEYGRFLGAITSAPSNSGALDGDYFVWNGGSGYTKGVTYRFNGSSWTQMGTNEPEKLLKALTAMKVAGVDFSAMNNPNTVSWFAQVVSDQVVSNTIKAVSGFFDNIDVGGASSFHGAIDSTHFKTYGMASQDVVLNISTYSGTVFGEVNNHSVEWGTTQMLSGETLKNILSYYGTHECRRGSITVDGVTYVATASNPIVVDFYISGVTIFEKLPSSNNGLMIFYSTRARSGRTRLLSNNLSQFMYGTTTPAQGETITSGTISACSLVAHIEDSGAKVLTFKPLLGDSTSRMGTATEKFESMAARMVNAEIGHFSHTVSALYFLGDLKGNASGLTDEGLATVYPIGAIYLSVNHTSPASLFGGTWEMLQEGFALWTSSSGAGGTIGAGLPNITGGFSNQSFVVSRDLSGTGAIRTSLSSYARGVSSSGSQTYGQFSFDASRSSSIYGGSNTVQPPAIKVYAWKRVS